MVNLGIERLINKLVILLWKCLFLLLFLVFLNPVTLNSQSNYKKNSYVNWSCERIGSNYEIALKFKDHFGEIRGFKLLYSASYTDMMIQRFGIPKSYFEPYLLKEDIIKERKKVIERGLFRQNGSILEVDKAAIVDFYAEAFSEPIAEYIIGLLKEEGKDTRLNRIEFALSLVQDIPYGIPDPEDDERFYGGILVPPQVLIEGYGDCDSKSMLFASILMYLINPEDIVFLGQKGHVLTAVKVNEVAPGMHYYELEDGKYAIAETAGPAKNKLGLKGTNTQNVSVIEPLVDGHDHIYASPDIRDNSNLYSLVTEDFSIIDFEESEEELLTELCYTVKAENRTDNDVKLLLKYCNLKRDWVSLAWYNIPPNTTKTIAKTQNKYIYFYGVSENGDWKGNHQSEFEGKMYFLNEMYIDGKNFGEFTIVLMDE